MRGGDLGAASAHFGVAMDRTSANPIVDRIPLPSTEFLCRLGLTAILAIIAHQFHWEGLRFLTSESMLRLSALLGMTTSRIAFDTIQVQGHFIQFVASCTFAEMFLGSVPLIWRLNGSLLKNLILAIQAAGALFCLNILRLELGQVAYHQGISWTLAHDIPLGFVYFTVWFNVFRMRSWLAWKSEAACAAQ